MPDDESTAAPATAPGANEVRYSLPDLLREI